ncbi:uncharacterized protein LOC112571437 [Pomacea canaliculata]|uniref:uncharacterized protein LOC112571437 n=1 Tax=Pomacea canaliculata TaxID=400727 RepID=UPI000D72ABAE|nr:uncharacterized protein LOC112571437 [Pomacea canaliculata]
MANEGVSSDALAFRQMLVRLDSKITPQELEKMKIYCKDILGTKIRDQIRSFVALCEKLEERKRLSRKEMTFFETMLTLCTDGRLDVLDILNEFRNQITKVGGWSAQRRSEEGNCIPD